MRWQKRRGTRPQPLARLGLARGTASRRRDRRAPFPVAWVPPSRSAYPPAQNRSSGGVERKGGSKRFGTWLSYAICPLAATPLEASETQLFACGEAGEAPRQHVAS